MPRLIRTCRQPECGNTYHAAIDHPGNVLDCPSCAREHCPPPRGMTFSVNKHAAENVLVITHDRAQADAFYKAQKRPSGQGVIGSLVSTKANYADA